MMYPLVRELANDGIPVTVTCRVLKIARAPYYRWLTQPVAGAERVEAYRANALFDAHRDDPEFGYRYLLDEAADAGQQMCERTAWRICSSNGWWSAFGKPGRAKRAKRPGPPVHDDLCAVVDEHGLTRHEFTAEAPNELWLADITEHRTAEGKLYLCAVKDVYSNRIVGYSIDSRMKSRLAVTALNNAVARRGGDVAGCVLHTDRGSQGGFNWSSQHLVVEVFSGSSSAGSRSGGSSEVEVAWSSEVPAACRGGVLGADRCGVAARRGRRCGRRGASGGRSVVPQRWRDATVRSDVDAHGQAPLLRRA
ncbi:DDE-type integrase/transposase/recombinase [Janibacter sp. UYMM211]|uniref:DDE-type integrase/transposase/recombinase n=1 Tax=Janibacter sp. UYMM211 TaxID=3156342 RepID=UPI00339B8FC3